MEQYLIQTVVGLITLIILFCSILGVTKFAELLDLTIPLFIHRVGQFLAVLTLLTMSVIMCNEVGKWALDLFR